MATFHLNATRSCFALVAWVLICAAPVSADEFRTWSDATGQFKLEAKLVSQTADKVRIADKSGEEFEIEISKLGKADQDYLKELAAKPNPFKKVENNPFKKTTTPAPSTVPAPAEPSAKLTPQEVKVNWSGSKTVALVPENNDWKYAAGGVPQFDFQPRPVTLPKKSDFFEGQKGTAINPSAGRAAVGYMMKGRGRDKDGVTRVELCDLETGKIVASGTESGEMVPLAIHDDGQQILMRRNEFGFGNLDRLEVWAIGKGNVSKGLSWIPYDDANGAARDVMWAEFLDAEHLVTSSRNGKIAIWDFESARPLVHFQTVEGAVPALSGDRSTIAFCTGDKIGLFDVKSKSVTSMQSVTGRMQWPYLAFSPSGQRLACIAFDRILVWDAETGELQRDFQTPGLNIHGGIAFPAENFLLANKNYLIDLENQLKLWQFDGAEDTAVVGEYAFFGVNSHNSEGILLPVKLPHAPALDMLDKAINRPDLFVFRSGTSVKLDASGIPDDHRKQVEQALTAKLQEMNCPVNAQGTITLKASVSGPTKKTVSFFTSGDYDVKEYRTNLAFEYQGKNAWSSGSTNIPGVVTIKRGENLESILREKSKAPNYSFFDTVTLPKFLQNPTVGAANQGQQTLGRSRVTVSGLQ